MPPIFFSDMIKIYQINIKTWVWILYDDKGNQLIVSKECGTQEDCEQNIHLVVKYITVNHDKLDEEYPEFITHH